MWPGCSTALNNPPPLSISLVAARRRYGSHGRFDQAQGGSGVRGDGGPRRAGLLAGRRRRSGRGALAGSSGGGHADRQGHREAAPRGRGRPGDARASSARCRYEITSQSRPPADRLVVHGPLHEGRHDRLLPGPGRPPHEDGRGRRSRGDLRRPDDRPRPTARSPSPARSPATSSARASPSRSTQR